MKRYAIAFGLILAVIGGTAIVTQGDDRPVNPGPPPSKRRVRYINVTATARAPVAHVSTVVTPTTEADWTTLVPTDTTNAADPQVFWEILDASVKHVRIKIDTNNNPDQFEKEMLKKPVPVLESLPSPGDFLEIYCVLTDATAADPKSHNSVDWYHASSGRWERVP